MMLKLIIMISLASGMFTCYRSEDYQWPVRFIYYLSRTFTTKVIWGNNEFVMANSQDTYKSVDGKTWVDSLGNMGANNIAWGNNQYVNVGGSIIVSPDAVNWARVLESVSYSLNDVVWSGSQFIAVGDNGTIMVSTDGLIWSTIDSGITDNLQIVKWAGSRYYTMGGEGRYLDKVYLSVDGQKWDAASLPEVSDDFFYYGKKIYYYDVVYGKNGYVFATDKSSFYSSDGISWLKIESNFGMKNVTWCDSSLQFVGVSGGGGWFDAPRIYTSADGQTWYEHWNAEWGGDLTREFYPDSIACHGETYVIGGRCPDPFAAGEYSCVMTSP